MIQHSWNLTPKEAIALQKRLRTTLRFTPLTRTPAFVAGADVSIDRGGDKSYAGIIVLSYPALETVTYAVAASPLSFPYIPGLLSFREIPSLMKCWEALSIKPDVVMVDGQGIAHPRHMGIASHLGLLITTPTIGVAKSRLYGNYTLPTVVGTWNTLLDPVDGEPIGVALKSKARSHPLIISPGHLITLTDALALVRTTLAGYRLPEPTRRAHILVNDFRRGTIPAQY
ncbi:MAG TPA: deoxyribonuclease V [Candidatus Paceibacterota bacterium]|nr:deoxyribonuclease V [Candidatus Paceibacterota bacterium]